MKIVAIAMVKDEEDVIEQNVRHLLGQGIAAVIIADNLSTDRTPDILAKLTIEFPTRVLVQLDREPAYYQAEKMTALLDEARSLDPDWILPFDADEIFLPTKKAPFTITDILSAAGEGIEAVAVLSFNHFLTCMDVRADRPFEPDPFKRLQWRHREPNRLSKVIVRPVPGIKLTQGNHHAIVGGRSPIAAAVPLQIRHFPYRSAEHFARKAINGSAAYKAAKDLPYNMGEHWRMYGEIYERGGEAALHDWFNRYFFLGLDRMKECEYDPVTLSR